MKKSILITMMLAFCADAQIRPNSVVFSGTGLNDATSRGIANSAGGDHVFIAKITTAGAPDQFEWQEDGGSFSSPINIVSGVDNLISGGVTIRFAASTGHTVNDQWSISTTVAGSVAAQTDLQPGVGAIFRSLQTVTRELPRRATAYGAVCNGITDPSAPGYHDDYQALMNAHNSLPLNQFNGNLPVGEVIIPTTSVTLSGCVIGPNDPGLQWSPFVHMSGASGSTTVSIISAQGFAPQVNSATITGINTCGGGTVCTITAMNNFLNGDTVEIHGVVGPWQVNSWGNFNQYPINVSGMWTVTNATSTQFQLLGSDKAIPVQPAYVSGGTAVKGTEKFIITILNSNGPSNPYPNNNYDVSLNNVCESASRRHRKRVHVRDLLQLLSEHAYNWYNGKRSLSAVCRRSRQ